MDEDLGQRRFPRIPSDNVVLVKPLEDDAEEELVKTGVVGLGGCSLLTRTALGPDSLVRLLIAVGDHVVRAEARVVYENERPDGRHETGVEFMRLTEGDRALLEGLLEDASPRKS